MEFLARAVSAKISASSKAKEIMMSAGSLTLYACHQRLAVPIAING